MAILLSELIDQLPSDTAERVSKTKERLNTRVRDALRHETGLKLNRGVSEAENSSAVSVPIKVLPGVPAPLGGFAIPDEHKTSVLLAPLRQQLQQLRDSSKTTVEKLVPLLAADRRIDHVVGGRESYLRPVWSLAEDLLKEADKYDLAKEILAVQEDVLGTYSFGRSGLYSDPECRIELYWGIIGLVAMQIGIEVEDLTVVVLAHELAHAYTHRGFDIDGERWEMDHFAKLDKRIVEGLAQHYAMLVSKRITAQAPHALAAYRALLERQPEPYRAQIPWETSFTAEQVRLAMLRVRRMRTPASLEQFTETLGESKDQLRRGEPAAADSLF